MAAVEDLLAHVGVRVRVRVGVRVRLPRKTL